MTKPKYESFEVAGLEGYTIPRPTFDMIDTQWGRITYAEWCRLEAKRLGNGFRAIQRKGLVAVFGPKWQGRRGACHAV